MRYEDLVDMMTKLDAQRITLVVHPDDEAEIQEAVRQIGDMELQEGRMLLAPKIMPHPYAPPGQILIMHPKEEQHDG